MSCNIKSRLDQFIEQQLQQENLKSLTRKCGYNSDYPVSPLEKERITKFIINKILANVIANFSRVSSDDCRNQIRTKFDEIDFLVVESRPGNSYDLDFEDFRFIFNGIKNFFKYYYYGQS